MIISCHSIWGSDSSRTRIHWTRFRLHEAVIWFFPFHLLYFFQPVLQPCSLAMLIAVSQLVPPCRSSFSSLKECSPSFLFTIHWYILSILPKASRPSSAKYTFASFTFWLGLQENFKLVRAREVDYQRWDMNLPKVQVRFQWQKSLSPCLSLSFLFPSTHFLGVFSKTEKRGQLLAKYWRK